MMFCPATASIPLDIMKKTIAILVLAAVGITTMNAGVRFGVNFAIPLPVPIVTTTPVPVVTAPVPFVAPPPMPASIVEIAPACPTPGYVWVGGNWGWCDNRWLWTRGHWGQPAHWDRGWDRGCRAEHRETFHRGFHSEHGRH
jgi:hypothetical protein